MSINVRPASRLVVARHVRVLTRPRSRISCPYFHARIQSDSDSSRPSVSDIDRVLLAPTEQRYLPR
jgi:hypothetical protein